MHFLAPACKQMSLQDTRNPAVGSEHDTSAHMGESAWELGMPCFGWLSHLSLGSPSGSQEPGSFVGPFQRSVWHVRSTSS